MNNILRFDKLTDSQKFIIHTVCKAIHDAQQDGLAKEKFYLEDGTIVTVIAENNDGT